MYMRLLGYPAEKITILTTYNGQKHLIRDVVEQRCASNPFIGRPSKISTVDKFQGQQNDYILLSLVRTKTVGHIRDVRRLIVAMSRARLGLYVFCRQNLFSSCYELQHTFSLFNKHPNKLQLITTEHYSTMFTANRNSLSNENILTVENMPAMVQFVFDFYKQQVERMREEQPNLFQSIINPNKNINEQETAMENNESDSKNNTDKDNEMMNEEEMVSANVDDDDELPFEKIAENDTGMDDEVELPEEDNEGEDEPTELFEN